MTETDSGLHAWEHELDDMEAYLEAHRDAFRYRDSAVPPHRDPTPLEVLGPLPDTLRARAEELLRATRAFEGEVVGARGSLATALRHAERSSRRPASVYVDARV